jgi:hybrid cluster-associated redox disulfide protein
MKKIDKHMTVTEILAVDPIIANILSGQGMNCLFCGAAVNETLEEACLVHGIEGERIDLLVTQINDFLGVPEGAEDTCV